MKQVNLNHFFALQKQLDKTIHENHNISYDDVKKELNLALLVEVCELANEIRSFKFWSNRDKSPDDIVLDEYADCIHFITSICISFDIDANFELSEDLTKYQNKKEITNAILDLIAICSELDTQCKARLWYTNFLNFGLKLGYSLDDIKDAYDKKNKVNHNRQNTNY